MVRHIYYDLIYNYITRSCRFLFRQSRGELPRENFSKQRKTRRATLPFSNNIIFHTQIVSTPPVIHSLLTELTNNTRSTTFFFLFSSAHPYAAFNDCRYKTHETTIRGKFTLISNAIDFKYCIIRSFYCFSTRLQETYRTATLENYIGMPSSSNRKYETFPATTILISTQLTPYHFQLISSAC